VYSSASPRVELAEGKMLAEYLARGPRVDKMKGVETCDEIDRVEMSGGVSTSEKELERGMGREEGAHPNELPPSRPAIHPSSKLRPLPTTGTDLVMLLVGCRCQICDNLSRLELLNVLHLPFMPLLNGSFGDLPKTFSAQSSV